MSIVKHDTIKFSYGKNAEVIDLSEGKIKLRFKAQNGAMRMAWYSITDKSESGNTLTIKSATGHILEIKKQLSDEEKKAKAKKYDEVISSSGAAQEKGIAEVVSDWLNKPVGDTYQQKYNLTDAAPDMLKALQMVKTEMKGQAGLSIFTRDLIDKALRKANAL